MFLALPFKPPLFRKLRKNFCYFGAGISSVGGPDYQVFRLLQKPSNRLAPVSKPPPP